MNTDAHGYYTVNYRVPNLAHVYMMARFMPRSYARTSDSPTLRLDVVR
ncbi:MAG: hypothetical protein M3Y35_11790 [Actinomycetota bacterium]|nr:hypothetical protein [Actinomycetota bacterium]